MKVLAASFLALSALLLRASPASAADDPKGFGAKSQLIISADRLVPLFSYTRASVTQTNNAGVELTDSRSGSGISLLWGRDVGDVFAGYPVNVHTIPRVAFDFTIIPKLTLGASLAFGFGLGGTDTSEAVAPGGGKTSRENDAPTATAIGVAPRVGYIIGLGELFAFWPRLGFGIYSVSAKQENLDNSTPPVLRTTSATDTLFSLDLDPQFVLVPVEHFFIHAGPIINIPIGGTRSVETTTGATTASLSNDISLFHFGLSAGLGGYFDL